jgi:GNAT superfamily N-acetyltransferase
MLDKTIPYAEIWMKRDLSIPVTPVRVSDKYTIEPYQSGNADEWARIETTVGEFATEAEGLAYFNRVFLPNEPQLAQRMFFAVNTKGEKVGTATAWWKEKSTGVIVPIVHWVAVDPSAQRQGIARGLVTKVLATFQNQTTTSTDIKENLSAVYLHTQTWSHAAIGLYQQLGFELIATDYQGEANPEYEKVIAILNDLS